MYRFIAFLIALTVAGLAAWRVFVNLDIIHVELATNIGITAGTVVAISLILYLPLLRHIADAIQDRFSTIHARFTATKGGGLGFDEIPQHTAPVRRTSGAVKINCSICGGPGGPVCEKCHSRMSRI